MRSIYIVYIWICSEYAPATLESTLLFETKELADLWVADQDEEGSVLYEVEEGIVINSIDWR